MPRDPIGKLLTGKLLIGELLIREITTLTHEALALALAIAIAIERKRHEFRAYMEIAYIEKLLIREIL